MTLAIFDLDNTLIGGDSDVLWGEFLAEKEIVDGEFHRQENQRFYEEYQAGTLDIYDFLAFSLKPLSEHPLPALQVWREQFVAEKIKPILLPKAFEAIQMHRNQGDTLLIITATNRFVTEPIATLLGISHLIATDPEMDTNGYTGRVAGTPSFQEGKVTRLDQWLETHDDGLDGSWFYSDSHNDLPLLKKVDHPVAVDPDASLKKTAEQEGWPVVSFR